MRIRFLNPPNGTPETVPWKDDQDAAIEYRQIRRLDFTIVDESRADEEGNPIQVIGQQCLRVDPALTGPEWRAQLMQRAIEMVAALPPADVDPVEIDIP